MSRGRRLKDERLLSLGRKYYKSAHQILLRWALQSEQIIIPNSAHKERIRENAGIFDFEITDEDMSAINAMDEKCSIVPGLGEPETSEKWK